MAFHIGKLILKHLDSMGMNKSEFARRIGVTPQNVYSIFRRESTNTELLFRISRVLGHDFFQYYTTTQPTYLMAAEGDQKMVSAGELETMIEALRVESELLKQENNYLRELNNLLRERAAVKAETHAEQPVLSAKSKGSDKKRKK